MVDPLMKECYEFPLFPLRFDKLMRRESCGLGFDTSTNTGRCWSDHRLVNLNGEVRYGCTMTMEFSLLNHKKEWVPHCRFKQEIVPCGFIKDVIGCWNKDGDILIKSIDGYPLHAFYLYNWGSDVLHMTNLTGLGTCPGIFMYPNTTFVQV
ncbi:hypothetical protein Tco_1186563 [Tanacetum coccineum]